MSSPVPVLLVDDDASNLLTLSALLEAEGFEVVTASTGDEARAAASERVFSAALVDRNLDGEDGMALAAELRASASSSAVFILSGHPPEADAMPEIDGWFLKGTSVDELIEHIRAGLPPS